MGKRNKTDGFSMAERQGYALSIDNAARFVARSSDPPSADLLREMELWLNAKAENRALYEALLQLDFSARLLPGDTEIYDQDQPMG